MIVAMTLDRSYRRGLALDTALAQVRGGVGTQLDPALVALFCTRELRDVLREMLLLS